MIPIHNELGKVRGHEVLYFENAELEKVKGNSTSFATFGSLSVLYFKDYNRYVLLLNDWKYPLLRRLPILGLDNQDAESRTYYLPASHGFAYTLKINKAHGSFSFLNLDAILENNSRFTWKNLDEPFRKAEESPDDHLSRHVKNEKASGKEVISESLKQSLHSMKSKIETLKHGTKNLLSKKKRVNQDSLKTKDFRKESHSKIKKSFFDSSKKSTSRFWQSRLANLNNITVSKYADLKNRDGPSLYLWREELEEAVLVNKDSAAQGLSSFKFALQKEDKSELLESIWSEAGTRANSIAGSIVGQGPMETHSRRESNVQREKAFAKIPENDIQLDKLTEGLTHYQG